MMLAVIDVVGLPGLPTTPMGVRKWLRSNGVNVEKQGKRFAFPFSSLPDNAKQAYLERACEEGGLPVGNYDDAAHAAFLAAPASLRAAAERRAAMARYLLTVRAHTGWPERLAMVRAKFGAKGVSKPSLKRLLADVKGVDPINFAPALLPGYRSATPLVPVSAEAWSFFMTTIRDAGPAFPLKQAWRDVRDVAMVRGWDWPSFPTIYRRWTALPEADKIFARHGKDEARKRLTQPVQREKPGVLEWVSQDGRTKDFWCDWGDGKAIRSTALMLVDVGSNAILGWRLCRSENAADTAGLIKDTVARYGIFDRLYTDNSRAFAGHLVAGGNWHRYRNSGSTGIVPPGICFHLGINVHFATPAFAWVKQVERTFADLSRVIDDRPEFKGAHAGHAPGERPTDGVTPIPVDEARRIIGREVERYNREPGRRARGADGRSYQQVLEAGLKAREAAGRHRVATDRQLYLAGLIYKTCSVDRNGQVKIGTWTYGGPETMLTLLPYNGNRQRIFFGRDPNDFGAPGIAFDLAGNLICEPIAPIVPGKYDSTDGARTAARNRKAAADAQQAAEDATQWLADEDMRRALAALPDHAAETPRLPAKVVGGRFGSPLRDRSAEDAPGMVSVPEDFYRNMDRALAARRGEGG